MHYDHNKKFGLLKFHSGYGKKISIAQRAIVEKKLTHRLHNYITWITDIWPSDFESSDVGFCSGASFSVKGWAKTVCSSVCVGGGVTFFTFASVLP